MSYGDPYKKNWNHTPLPSKTTVNPRIREIRQILNRKCLSAWYIQRKVGVSLKNMILTNPQIK